VFLLALAAYPIANLDSGFKRFRARHGLHRLRHYPENVTYRTAWSVATVRVLSLDGTGTMLRRR
jgi:hypothetical protein